MGTLRDSLIKVGLLVAVENEHMNNKNITQTPKTDAAHYGNKNTTIQDHHCKKNKSTKSGKKQELKQKTSKKRHKTKTKYSPYTQTPCIDYRCTQAIETPKTRQNILSHNIYSEKATNVVQSQKQLEIPNIELEVFHFDPQPISAIEEFKYPDEWVISEHKLQNVQEQNARHLPIKIGIDFGTAYTKLAIEIADSIFFVPWDGIRNTSSENKYFLPGEISASKEGMFYLGKCPDAQIIINNLKKPFLSDSTNNKQLVYATIFLTWVIRYARAWVISKFENKLLFGRKVIWQLHLGTPSNNQKWKHGDTYNKIATSAWYISHLHIKKFTFEFVEQILSSGLSRDQIGLDSFHLIPEFAAQIAGYTQSQQRMNGLHMLVDVGASTLDVSLFNVYNIEDIEGEDDKRLPILTGNVQPLGTHFLMQERFMNLEIKNTWSDYHSSLSTESFAEHFSIDLAEANIVDRNFINKVRVMIYKSMHITKTKRHPNAHAWKNGLRTFVAGGGSRCSLYLKATKEAFEQIGVNIIEIGMPIPQGIDVDSNTFHRLSVAYGLTFDSERIGKIQEEHEIEDILQTNTCRVVIDTDELYS